MNQGKIYKIEAMNGDENDVYYGSTKQKYLHKRFFKHKSNYKAWKEGKFHKLTSFNIFDKYGIDNCQIILVENVNYETKDELKAREAYYIKTFNCVNRNIPCRTKKEHYEDNKEHFKLHRKEYYENNKEEIAQKNKEYYENNKEKIQQYKKDYNVINKENIKQQRKEYREINKEKIKENKSAKCLCECGREYTYGHKSRHEKSKFHIENIPK